MVCVQKSPFYIQPQFFFVHIYHHYHTLLRPINRSNVTFKKINVFYHGLLVMILNMLPKNPKWGPTVPCIDSISLYQGKAQYGFNINSLAQKVKYRLPWKNSGQPEGKIALWNFISQDNKECFGIKLDFSNEVPLTKAPYRTTPLYPFSSASTCVSSIQLAKVLQKLVCGAFSPHQ